MGNISSYIKKEDGAAQLIEAAIIYPIVFLCIFFLIYIGLFILQSMTVSAYAQKVALLASREIAYPGYIEMVSGGNNSYSPYSNSAVEGDETLRSTIKLETNPKEVQARAYRYWSSDPIKGNTSGLEKILKTMINNNSIIAAENDVQVKITADNYFIVQYVTVEVSQPLMKFPVLDYLGIKTPTVSATATASVNDTDEFVRNVDFVTDALESLANKLGINVSDIKDKIAKAKETLGLN